MTEDEMKDFLYKIEGECARDVDAIIMQFAERGRWPNNALDYAYFLARRIEYAMEILSVLGSLVHEQRGESMTFVAHEVVPPPTARPDIIVRWLLLICWEYGRSHWIDRFILSAGRK